MRKLGLIFLVVFLFSGCSIANTPTAQVEDYLGKYQKLDDRISLSYIQLSGDEDISEDNRGAYQKLVERQYKNLSYEVKEESLDGEDASVTVQIEVYDYKEIIDKYNENSYSNDEYHNLVINDLEKQKDKIVYTIIFELSKNENDEWVIVEPSLDERKKLLGIN